MTTISHDMTPFERRIARNRVLDLMQHCLNVCDQDIFIKEVTMNLSLWAVRSGDNAAMQKAEDALIQMGMAPGKTQPRDARRDLSAQSPAVAAIEFAVRAGDGLSFLACWLQGDFDTIRNDWPDCPTAAFFGVTT